MNPDGSIEDLVNPFSRQRRTFNVSSSPDFVSQSFSLKWNILKKFFSAGYHKLVRKPCIYERFMYYVPRVLICPYWVVDRANPFCIRPKSWVFLGNDAQLLHSISFPHFHKWFDWLMQNIGETHSVKNEKPKFVHFFQKLEFIFYRLGIGNGT